MTRLTSTVFVDGERVEPNSGRGYAASAEVLRRIDALLQDGDPIWPDVLRDDVRKLRSRVMALGQDAAAVAADCERWDGDLAKALRERDFRRGSS